MKAALIVDSVGERSVEVVIRATFLVRFQSA